MRKITEIILHCSATREGQDKRASDIKNWHLKRGFKDIGYHYIIDLDGKIEVGRPDEKVGAHVSGHNTNSIGICYIGGLDDKDKPKDTRTEKQKYSMLNLLIALTLKYRDITKITGHNRYVNKACPCFDVEQWLDDNNLGRFKA